MKKLLLVTAASLVVTPAAQAHTSEKVLFTCEGELTKTQGANAKPYYDIVESWKAEGERDSCDIGEGEPLRQILAVCRVGDFCTVAAKGESGNGGTHLIQKVFEVKRQPARIVQDLKRDSKQTASLLTTPPFAAPAVVHSCEASLDSIGNLVEPVRSFANGAIRVAHISTSEPAAASEHLIIFVTAKDDEGGAEGAAECFAVSAPRGSGYEGFYSLDFAKMQASYDEQSGLLLRIAASENGSEKPVGYITVRISRKNDNSVTIERD